VVETVLVVVDENTGGDVHGIHQHQTFLYTAFHYGLLHIARNVNQSSALWDVEK
jgi:hypothetical protein